MPDLAPLSLASLSVDQPRARRLAVAAALLLAGCTTRFPTDAPGPKLPADTGPAARPTDSGPAGDGADGADATDGADGATDSASPDTDPPAPPVDADSDGATADIDCDDADPSRFPGAPERCDGIDQNCDGLIDEGVPTDGAGCQDPGPPALPGTVGTVTIGLRTHPGVNDGSDDPVTVCLAPGRCAPINVLDWDDREPGSHDLTHIEGLGWSRAELSAFTISTTAGADQWRPACFEVRLDGDPVYCREISGLAIGDAAGESRSWTDPAGFGGSSCETCAAATLTHGPMVGAVRHDSATVWLRTDATRRVALRVATSAGGLASAAPVALRYPVADRDFTESIDVFGLSPETSYLYELEVDGARTGPFRFTTPPAPGAGTRLRVGLGSCARDEAQPIFGAIAALDPDLFLFLGDNHYGDTNELEAHRQHYRAALDQPLRAGLLRGRSVLHLWDDHDYVGNNTDGAAPGKESALAAFTEYTANRDYGEAGLEGVFSRHVYGDVEVFLVDGRYHRGEDGHMLGAAQEAWLLDALQSSAATFKLVANGSQWATDSTSESWGDFPGTAEAFREQLVLRGVEGVVFLSGDIHRSELRALRPATGGYPLPELTSSPLATTGAGCRTFSDTVACVGETTSFILIDIDTTSADPTLTAQIIDGEGRSRAEWTLLASELRLPAGLR